MNITNMIFKWDGAGIKKILPLLFILVVIWPVSTNVHAACPDEIPDPAEEAAAQDTGFLEAGDELMLFEDIPVVITTASKYEQEVGEAPSAVTVITSEEIRNYGYRNLADVLRSVRGFYVSYDRDYSYLGVRGFGRPGDYNSRVLLLIDGHQTNENISDSAAIGNEFLLDVDLIDRVEIIRGPGSSLYGSNALFAVINVITKSGKALEGFEMAGELGSFNTRDGRTFRLKLTYRF